MSFLSATDGVELPPNPWFSWDYVMDHVDELVAAGQEHLLITVAAVALAMVVAVPLALLVRRYRRLRSPVLALGGVLYTIPALALISVLWPVFGLSPVTVTIALAVYALLVVLRNTLVGLEGVPDDVVDAARGMGYGARRMLWQVELPLALPAILAGVRLAVVSTVGLVTIGALVGHGGFGTLIVGGFVDNFYHAQIMTATLLTVALAVVLDAMLLVLERVLTPWSRTRSPRSA